MIVAPKLLPIFITSFLNAPFASGEHLSPTNLRRGLGNGNSANGNSANGNHKLDASGCTIYEFDSLCEDPANPGRTMGCDDDAQHLSCEEATTGQMFTIVNDLEAEVESNPDFEADDDAFPGQGQGNANGRFQSGATSFAGDADIDMASATITLRSGKFSKSNGPRGKGPQNDGPPGQNRRHLATVGSRTLLAVRVVTTDSAPTYNEAHLSDSVFGTGSDQVNLKSQYSACSANQLNFDMPGSSYSWGSHSDGPVTWNNGVATISVPHTAAEGDDVLRNAVLAKLGTSWGGARPADHMMICVPDAAMGGIAYAWFNHWISVYKNTWCTFPSVQLHEVGHNLGLHHSGEGATYDDQSGFMGYSYSQDEQKMCFNGPKNWQLGWFSDRHVDLPANQSWSGRLYAPTRYASTASINNNKMIVRIPGTQDHYVSFNGQESYNANTAEGQNRVLVHYKQGGPTATAESKLVAKLAVGGTFTANGVPIKVDSINGSGYATVTIGTLTTPPPTAALTPPPTEPLVPVTPNPTPPIPVTPNPTPVITPNPTPAVTAIVAPAYNLACGSSQAGCKNTEQIARNDEFHAVRCCASTQIGPGWVDKCSSVPVFGESEVGLGATKICNTQVTYSQAVALCAAEGARLCTQNEVLSDCTKGSGCSFDSRMIWTSTENFCNADADCGTSDTCTTSTCNAGVCENLPVAGCSKKITCGASTNTRCAVPRNDDAGAAELHEVRCCAEQDMGWGYAVKSKCAANVGQIWGTSRGLSSTCYASRTYAQATQICSDMNARLCTIDELKNDCTQGTGCSFDKQHIWSSTDSAAACQADADCDDGLDCTLDTCTSGVCLNTVAGTCSAAKAVTCGDRNSRRCVRPKLREADPKHLHQVRCCSSTNMGWGNPVRNECRIRMGYPVWATSQGCHKDKTFAEANQICTDAGARLCTIEELEANCSKGTGCQFDKKHLWSSSDYQSAASMPAATTESPLTGTEATVGGTTEATPFMASTPANAEIWSTTEATPATGGDGENLLSIAEAVVEACDESVLAQDMSGCQAYCHDRMCCFETGEYSCLDDPEKHCLVYAGCETLLGSNW